MTNSNNVNLDDLPYDEYQKEMARLEAEAAEQAKNAELGVQAMPENEDQISFDDFVNRNKSASTSDMSDDVSDDIGATSSDQSDAMIDTNNHMEPNSEGVDVDTISTTSDSADLGKLGAKNTISGAFQNFLGGIKGLFASGAAGTAQTIANIGEKMGVPRPAVYGILFILGGGTFAGITALLGKNSDLYMYDSVSDDCQVMSVTYHENTVYKAPSQDELDGRAGSLFNALNSDMHFDYGIRNGGTKVTVNIQDDVKDDGASYYYSQKLEDRYDWNEDGKIDEKDDRSRLIKGGYHHYESTVDKFQDEQILGMIMNASAESKIDPATYEMNYRVGLLEDGKDEDYVNLVNMNGGDGSTEGPDIILSRTHHVQWNAYCERMFALYAVGGLDINKEQYKYTTQMGATTNEEGRPNYYPGVGLWQWTGQRGYDLQWFANQLEFDSDNDGDGANDAMYTLNVQIAYLVEIEANPVVVNGTSIPIVEWGHEKTATYQVEYYVNVPYKTGIGTSPGNKDNWIPLSDYQDPSARGLSLPFDALNQLPDNGSYKYESQTGARLIDRDCDNKQDATYFNCADGYDGFKDFDDSPFPVKDFVYGSDGSLARKKDADGNDMEYTYMTGTVEWDETNADGSVTHHKTEYTGYDLNKNGVIVVDSDGDGVVDTFDPGDAFIQTDGTLWINKYVYKSVDADGDGTSDVWDLNNNGKADQGEYYIGTSTIYVPEEVYYQNICVMVLAAGDGDYNEDDYIYEDSSNSLSQYADKTCDYDGPAIIYQSPDIMDTDMWKENPWNSVGTYTVAPGYNAIQENDDFWSDLEAAIKDNSKYGTESNRNKLRETTDTWRDEIWVWSNAHARGAVARNRALEFATGWVGCAGKFIESHTRLTDGDTFAGRKDTMKYGKKADCLVHYAECMLTQTWHGDDSAGKSIADLLYEDMNSRHVRNIWNPDNGYCGGDFDNSSIAACAVSWAWLEGHVDWADINTSNLDPMGYPASTKCTSLYCAVKDIVLPNDPFYSSCDRGAATAVRASGSDDNYPAGNPKNQYDYMLAHPDLWEEVGSVSSAWSQIQPGDIICSSSEINRHIIVFVGEDVVYEKWGESVGDATNAIVHSSHSKHIDNARGPRCDLDGTYLKTDGSHGFYIFRCKNKDLDSSELKQEIDDQASTLGGLANGDGKGGGKYEPQYD